MAQRLRQTTTTTSHTAAARRGRRGGETTGRPADDGTPAAAGATTTPARKSGRRTHVRVQQGPFGPVTSWPAQSDAEITQLVQLHDANDGHVALDTPQSLVTGVADEGACALIRSLQGRLTVAAYPHQPNLRTFILRGGVDARTVMRETAGRSLFAVAGDIGTDAALPWADGRPMDGSVLVRPNTRMVHGYGEVCPLAYASAAWMRKFIHTHGDHIAAVGYEAGGWLRVWPKRGQYHSLLELQSKQLRVKSEALPSHGLGTLTVLAPHDAGVRSTALAWERAILTVSKHYGGDGIKMVDDPTSDSGTRMVQRFMADRPKPGATDWKIQVGRLTFGVSTTMDVAVVRDMARREVSAIPPRDRASTGTATGQQRDWGLIDDDTSSMPGCSVATVVPPSTPSHPAESDGDDDMVASGVYGSAAGGANLLLAPANDPFAAASPSVQESTPAVVINSAHSGGDDESADSCAAFGHGTTTTSANPFVGQATGGAVTPTQYTQSDVVDMVAQFPTNTSTIDYAAPIDSTHLIRELTARLGLGTDTKATVTHVTHVCGHSPMTVSLLAATRFVATAMSTRERKAHLETLRAKTEASTIRKEVLKAARKMDDDETGVKLVREWLAKHCTFQTRRQSAAKGAE